MQINFKAKIVYIKTLSVKFESLKKQYYVTTWILKEFKNKFQMQFKIFMENQFQYH